MMLNDAEIVDDNMVVAEYEEIAVVDDINDMSELVVENEEYDDVHDVNDYGGMPIDQYNDIVAFKRTNSIPDSILSRHDRSAPSHWRARCKCFSVADDQETLLYYNPENPGNTVPKVVVKKGEVPKVLQRVHELIGHLGQKRTQMVVLRKLYWRSVRQDVKTFIASCDFCTEKKLHGRKITKAPVDITSENFDISVSVRDVATGSTDRLEFQLVGYNEDEVREASYTRMTSYTFKETANQYRSRYSSQGPIFRRQPYVKKHNNQSIGYLVPFHQRSRTSEPEFLELYGRDEYPHHSEMIYETVPEIEDGMMRSREEDKRKVEHLSDAHPVTFCGTELSTKNFKTEEETVMEDSPSGAGPSSSSSLPESPQKQQQRYLQKHLLDMNSDRDRSSMRDYHSSERQSSPNPTTTASLVKKRRRELPSIRGMANRFSIAIGESDRIDNAEVSRSNPHLIEYPDPTSLIGGDNIGLPPVIMAPATNDEVCKLQIEALQRHIHLQKLQEKVLNNQYEASLRIPITRYIQQEEEVQEEQLEDEHDLNVIDNHHQVYEEADDVSQNQHRHIRHQ